MLVFNLGVDGFLGGGSLQIMSTNCVEGNLLSVLGVVWCGEVCLVWVGEVHVSKLLQSAGRCPPLAP